MRTPHSCADDCRCMLHTLPRGGSRFASGRKFSRCFHGSVKTRASTPEEVVFASCFHSAFTVACKTRYVFTLLQDAGFVELTACDPLVYAPLKASLQRRLHGLLVHAAAQRRAAAVAEEKPQL